jgi:hypothetical protein
MSCGNLASLVMKIVLYYTADENTRGDIRTRRIILGASVAGLALGAFFAWIWIPEVQTVNEGVSRKSGQLQEKTLEELAEGLLKAQQEGQVIGLRSRVFRVFKPKR